MTFMRAFNAVSFLSIASIANASPSAPEVVTSSGAIRGAIVRDARVFLGIPYASAPVGELRWRPPIDAKPWAGVKDATKFGPSCFQKTSEGSEMWGPYTWEFAINGDGVSEDCLSLNVWAPRASKRNLPVLVWIHGGGFGGGSSATPIFDGSRLAAKGALVVTINYRVGPFGFLAHPQRSAESPNKISGNYGLLDMMAALRWVRLNARKFGGDPSKVTVAGQSAGAMSINTLMQSPKAKGLFAGAIAQSGTAAGQVTVPMKEAEAMGVTLAKKLGVSSAEELRRLPAQNILDASGMGRPEPGGPPPVFYVPVVDGKLVTVDPNDPSRAVVKVPLLTGYNMDEGKDVTLGLTTTPADFRQSVGSRFGAFAERVLLLYPHATPEEASTSADTLSRDMVLATLTAWAGVRAHKAKAGVYIYNFDHAYPGAGVDKFGSFHTAEVPYVFGVLDTRGPFTAQDHEISDRVQSYWLNFMRTGNPNGKKLPSWPAVVGEASKVMWLGDRGVAAPAVSTPDRAKLLREVVAAQGYSAFL